jgi:hypothetical protein
MRPGLMKHWKIKRKHDQTEIINNVACSHMAIVKKNKHAETVRALCGKAAPTARNPVRLEDQKLGVTAGCTE